MRWLLACVVLLSGCGDGVDTDAGPSSDGASGIDGASLDAGECSGTELLFDLGHCFEARRCCVDADCGTDRTWACNAAGLCEDAARACACVDDLDCAGEFCFTNAVVCGECRPAGDLCATDVNCPAGACVDGYCADETTCVGYPTP